MATPAETGVHGGPTKSWNPAFAGITGSHEEEKNAASPPGLPKGCIRVRKSTAAYVIPSGARNLALAGGELEPHVDQGGRLEGKIKARFLAPLGMTFVRNARVVPGSDL